MRDHHHHTEPHDDHDLDHSRGRAFGHRRGRGRGPHGHGRQRARRGAVGAAILALLDERPMHGYELIGALEERSGGRWKPSPGSIYPALHRLEDRGFITASDRDGTNDATGAAAGHDAQRRYELTDDGRDRLAEHRLAGNAEPWNEHGLGSHGELRRAMSELTGPARQIGRFGSPDQIVAAVAAVKVATASLYRILAEGSTTPTEAPVDDTPNAD